MYIIIKLDKPYNTYIMVKIVMASDKNLLPKKQSSSVIISKNHESIMYFI